MDTSKSVTLFASYQYACVFHILGCGRKFALEKHLLKSIFIPYHVHSHLKSIYGEDIPYETFPHSQPGRKAISEEQIKKSRRKFERFGQYILRI